MDGETHIAVNAEALDQHLLFHKALIDDADDAEKIDRYRALLADDTEGERMLNPVDESIRAAFSLVLEHDMDPWAINLEEFVKVYGRRVQNSEFDMIVAGKLMLMAWRILRMQSNAAVISSEEPQEIEGFDEGFEGFEFEDDADQLYIPQVRFDPVIYRNAVRPVTVMELLGAFEEARQEMAVSAERERVRQELKAKEPRKFDNKAHDEDDEQDVDRVWQRIRDLGTGAFRLADLYTDDMKENITVFVSALHLLRDGKINLWQDELPNGDIFVEIKIDWAAASVETPKEIAEAEGVVI